MVEYNFMAMVMIQSLTDDLLSITPNTTPNGIRFHTDCDCESLAYMGFARKRCCEKMHLYLFCTNDDSIPEADSS